VEEAPLVLAVQRHIRRIEVEHDLGRSRPVRGEEQLDEQPLDRLGVGADAVVARQTAPRIEFQPVQGALAGERFVELPTNTPNSGPVSRRHRSTPDRRQRPPSRGDAQYMRTRAAPDCIV
jgi:hypothetical protein